ncbi:PREDICTED: uncharacterized protein LOC101821172, partial [Ficedula albicollis]|uniref:uncharacterized protein LOC101821172 n=1 Tax=Ficedula albicollis TaxID=59894 RepID=UPI00035933F6
MHPLVRNQERIAASKPKKRTCGKVWSEEEEALLSQLMIEYAGRRNINQLIMERIPSKTLKQISDKRRLLVQTSKEKISPPEVEQVVEDSPPVIMGPRIADPPRKGFIRQRYQDYMGRMLASGRSFDSGDAFERIFRGEDGQAVVNECFEKFFGGSESSSQDKKSVKGRKPKKRRKGNQRTTSWMKRRARKKGKYLRYQKLFYAHRKRLAKIILDDVEALQCQIPSGTVYSTFK